MIGKKTVVTMLAVTLAAPAFADSINFGQFGSEFTTITSPVIGTTHDGVSFTITGATDFTRYNEGSAWAGEFASGTPLLYVGSGQMVFAFGTVLTSLDRLSAQANLLGPYTATLNAYLGASLVFTSSYNGDNQLGPEGSIPYFSFNGSFDSLTISTTNDGSGFAVGAGAVPEPAAWALMITGFGFVGTTLRRRRTGYASA